VVLTFVDGDYVDKDTLTKSELVMDMIYNLIIDLLKGLDIEEKHGRVLHASGTGDVPTTGNTGKICTSIQDIIDLLEDLVNTKEGEVLYSVFEAIKVMVVTYANDESKLPPS